VGVPDNLNHSSKHASKFFNPVGGTGQKIHTKKWVTAKKKEKQNTYNGQTEHYKKVTRLKPV
jgi:hypothetical protein